MNRYRAKVVAEPQALRLGKWTRWVMFLQANSLTGPMPSANVRMAAVEPREEVTKGIDDTLKNRPEALVVLSQGVDGTVDEVVYDPVTGEVVLGFDDTGQNNGGHLIAQTVEFCAENNLSDSALLEGRFWQNLEPELNHDRALTINMTRRMDFMTKELHKGSFDKLKNVLAGQPYFDKIEWVSNSGGKKPDDIVLDMAMFSIAHVSKSGSLKPGLFGPNRLYHAGKTPAVMLDLLGHSLTGKQENCVLKYGEQKVVEILDFIDYFKFKMMTVDFAQFSENDFPYLPHNASELGCAFRAIHSKHKILKKRKNSDRFLRRTNGAVGTPLYFCRELGEVTTPCSLPEIAFTRGLLYGLGRTLFSPNGTWVLGSLEETKKFVDSKIAQVTVEFDNGFCEMLLEEVLYNQSKEEIQHNKSKYATPMKRQKRQPSDLAKDLSYYLFAERVCGEVLNDYRRSVSHTPHNTQQSLAQSV